MTNPGAMIHRIFYVALIGLVAAAMGILILWRNRASDMLTDSQNVDTM
jgi:hypothetical protein